MTEYFKKLLGYVQFIWAFLSGPIAFIVLIFNWGVDKVVAVSGDLLLELVNFALPGAEYDLTADAFVPLARINAVFPLAENWLMMLAFLSVAVSTVIFRFVKSLIPGFSH